MTIKFLDPNVRLPFDSDALLSKDPVRLTDYVRKLVKTLQEIQNRIVQVANLALEATNGSEIYLSLKDTTGDYPDGTWRLKQVDGNLEIQKKISGAWTKIAKHSE